MRVILVPRQPGRAPAAEELAGAGLSLDEQQVELATLAENSPLLASADALVVEVVPGSAADMEAFDRLIHLAGPQLAVIAAVDGLTVANTRQLLKAGAVDVLPIPFTAEELKQAVEPARRAQRPAARATPAQRRQGKVVAVLGALGGVGATSVAVQLGALWAGSSHVGLVDLDVQFGSAALFLDLRPSLNIGNLIEDAERLDTELLQSVAVRHSSGLEVVASPPDMMPMEAISPDFVDQLLRTAVQAYDLVLVDLPGVWTEWTVRALQRADLILLVTNPSVAGVYQARRQLEVLEANMLTPRLQIVANRVQGTLFKPRPDLKDTEAVLGRRIEHVLANDWPGMSAANDEGRMLKDVRASARLLKDMKELAARLSETLSAEVAP